MPRLKIATYNAENFFDRNEGDGPGAPKESHEVEALVRAVDRLNADVIAFQEVESQRALTELNDRLKKPYSYFQLVRGNYYRRLHLAFMSRHPFWYTSHKETILKAADGSVLYEYASPKTASLQQSAPLRFQRDVLLAEIEVPGFGICALFNLHLKSQSTNDWRLLENDTIRAAEARAAARIVSRYAHDNPGVPIVVLGDFNERVNMRSIRPLAPGLHYYDVIQQEWIGHSSPNYTYNKSPYRSRIDYLLLSPLARQAYRSSSVRVHRNNDTWVASDHFPVSCEMTLT